MTIHKSRHRVKRPTISDFSGIFRGMDSCARNMILADRGGLPGSIFFSQSVSSTSLEGRWDYLQGLCYSRSGKKRCFPEGPPGRPKSYSWHTNPFPGKFQKNLK